MGAHTAQTARQQYRALVADVAARAKEKLPQAVNGRVESAVKLVLGGDVCCKDDGTVEVSSASDPLKVYVLAGHACDCQDFSYGQAPDGWCQHRIAAGIAKRVQELLPPAAKSGPEVHTESTTAVPEAPASVNVRMQVAGRDVQLTLRDTDEGRLLARLEAVLQRYAPAQTTGAAPEPARAAHPPQQRHAAAMPRSMTARCAVHTCEMQRHQGTDGRTWYSHFDEAAGRWCKGK